VGGVGSKTIKLDAYAEAEKRHSISLIYDGNEVYARTWIVSKKMGRRKPAMEGPAPKVSVSGGYWRTGRALRGEGIGQYERRAK